ncbi:deoxyribonuclease V [Nitzschia inconspicua]|uniref:Deoxyribonuclease V n=1 Tax=Nitzschia inconspicua TaxID=303405 RepID=A0A9K3PIG7_9STRA|nr:deoxyribonuclease V [Nitzschia inconspicua]
MSNFSGKSKNQSFSSEVRKEIWNVEQAVVASLVQLEPDPPIDTSIIGESPLFQLIRNDHRRDQFSFSSQPEYYGGVDVSFPTRGDQEANNQQQPSVAVYVIIDKRTMKTVYQDHEFFYLEMPYIPTYLAFREIQPLQRLVHRQVHDRPELTPHAILVDGNGIWHPRNAGIACFLGTRLNLPTIGIGKSLLYEGGWTRIKLAEEMDTFVNALEHCIRGYPPYLKEQLQRNRGLIMKRIDTNPPSIGCQDSINSHDTATPDMAVVQRGHSMISKGKTVANHCDADVLDRQRALQELAPYCNGIAMPVRNIEDNSDSSQNGSVEARRFQVLGAALIGHGGRVASSANRPPISGSTQPIFVSVGHQLSLSKAVQITASLCLARIPEPVRQADLRGRELMRQMQQQQN